MESDFLKGLHDRHAEHNAHYGLKRGKVGSEAVHKPVKDYYRELQRLQARMEGRVNQLEMVPQLVGIIEVLVETIEGLDPPDRSLTRVARLAAQLASNTQNQNQEHGALPQTPRFGKGAADATKSNNRKWTQRVVFLVFLFAFDFGVKGLAPCSRNTLEEVYIVSDVYPNRPNLPNGPETAKISFPKTKSEQVA